MKAALRIVILTLFCVSLALADGLPSGEWFEEPPARANEYFRVTVGAKEDAIEMVFGERRYGGKRVNLSGPYKILTSKGHQEFQWRVSSLSVSGALAAYLGEQRVRTGDELIGIFHFQDDGSAMLTLFDEDQQPILKKTLRRLGRDK